jgi:spore coat polysaccharide biosynthesis predicted glycosyltransferase SpsG
MRSSPGIRFKPIAKTSFPPPPPTFHQMEILFRTKGSHKQGMGDVTSSLALAGEFRGKGHEVLFIINENDGVIHLIEKNGFDYSIGESLDEITHCIEGRQNDVSVLIQLNTPEEEALIFKNNSGMLVTIDDTGPSAKMADMRFNVLYPIEDSYTGFEYITLSSVFQKKHTNNRVIKETVDNILVLQGGSDTYGFIPKIVKALFNIPENISMNVIIGPNFAHDRELDQVLQKTARKFNIIRDINDLSDLMLMADVVITAGGIALFELACLGVPAIVICGERFEEETAQRFQDEGFGINLGFGRDVNEKAIYGALKRLMVSFNLRTAMSERGKALVDGRGIERISERISRAFNSLNNKM